MARSQPLSLVDIPWLRLASRASGVADTPAHIAARLVAGAYVSSDAKRGLTITARGQLALKHLTGDNT